MNEKTIWHTVEKRHYIVESETPCYYFLRVGKNTVKRVHKKFCVDSKPKNSYTLRVAFVLDIPDFVATILSEQHISVVLDDIFKTLNSRDRDYVRLGSKVFKKTEILSVELTDAKP